MYGLITDIVGYVRYQSAKDKVDFVRKRNAKDNVEYVGHQSAKDNVDCVMEQSAKDNVDFIRYQSTIQQIPQHTSLKTTLCTQNYQKNQHHILYTIKTQKRVVSKADETQLY